LWGTYPYRGPWKSVQPFLQVYIWTWSSSTQNSLETHLQLHPIHPWWPLSQTYLQHTV
jgi:hypothetical protein